MEVVSAAGTALGTPGVARVNVGALLGMDQQGSGLNAAVAAGLGMGGPAAHLKLFWKRRET